LTPLSAWLFRPFPVALLALLTACAPASKVVLLPQEGGRPSAVTVTMGQQVNELNRPYQTVAVSPRGSVESGLTTAAEVAEDYPALLRLQPAAGQTFTLHFQTGTAELTPESRALLPTVIETARSRAGGEIIVVGHTDRQGPADTNDRLSLQRANAIRDLLIEQGFQGDRIEPVGRGEREPLVPTDDEVSEPRNRRADIIVR